MRISDWSSDVCSSDLLRHLAGAASPVTALGCQTMKSCWLGNSAAAQNASQSSPGAFVAKSALVQGSCPFDIWLVVSRRSEEHTSELQSLMRISYAVFCLKKKTTPITEVTHPLYNSNNTYRN